MRCLYKLKLGQIGHFYTKPYLCWLRLGWLWGQPCFGGILKFFVSLGVYYNLLVF